MRGEGERDVERAAAGARSGAAALDGDRRAVVPRAAAGSCTTPTGPVAQLASAPLRLPEPRRARARRLHAARPSASTSSRRRAAAPTTAASARSSRCAAGTFIRIRIDRVLADIADARRRGARAIFLVDDNITLDVAPVRGAVPGDHRQRVQRRRLHRAGDDVAARAARRARSRR